MIIPVKISLHSMRCQGCHGKGFIYSMDSKDVTFPCFCKPVFISLDRWAAAGKPETIEELGEPFK